MSYPYTPLYYPTPTQVLYIEKNGTQTLGIVFHQYVINPDTRVYYTCDEIVENASLIGIHFDNAIIELE